MLAWLIYSLKMYHMRFGRKFRDRHNVMHLNSVGLKGVQTLPSIFWRRGGPEALRQQQNYRWTSRWGAAAKAERSVEQLVRRMGLVHLLRQTRAREAFASK